MSDLEEKLVLSYTPVSTGKPEMAVLLSVEFIYLIFTRMPGWSYRRRHRSVFLCPLLYLRRQSSALQAG